MFSNTAYEALYQYIGLELHSEFIEILTSQKVFLAVALLIFGFMFFMTTVQFFSRYLPGALIKKRSVPLSKYLKIVACLFLGMSLLRVGSSTSVVNFKGVSWHQNEYVLAKEKRVEPEYRVSFVFDLMSSSAEEIAAFITKIIDRLFKSTHSQLEAPSFFYKAIMYAGSSTIDDPNLKADISFYTSECIERALPLFAIDRASGDKIDRMFGSSREVDELLSNLIISHGSIRTCLDLKNQIREKLLATTQDSSGNLLDLVRSYLGTSNISEASWKNMQISMALVDHYLDERENFLGIRKESQPISGAARIYQYINKFFSWDSLTTLFAGREGQGASLAAKRAQEFSENLSRTPHVAGFIKLLLIAVFPWLVFPLIAGYWRVLFYWYLLYASVLMWAPLWTLFYHIMTNIALSAEVLESFGKLSDGISLYCSNLITSRMNYMYAVYSWIQLLVGVGFTGAVLWFARSLIADTESNSAPEFVGDSTKATSAASTVVAGVSKVL